VNVKNTIIAGNTAGTAPDCSAPLGLAINSQGYNLIGDATNCTGVGAGTHDITGVDAHLDVLAPNGNADGPTQTHALLGGSPAIDGGNPATPGSGGDACLAVDQRGIARDEPGDSLCDIGAYEAVPRPTTTTTTTTTSSTTTTTVTTTTSTTSTQSTTTTTAASTTSTTVVVTTTSSTTVTAPATTTTTTEPGCGATPPAATFVSIDCRLQALSAQLAGAAGLGKVAPKLMQSVDTATARKVDAESLCRASNLKKTKKRLQQAAKAMSQYAHRLSALNARKTIDPAVRQSFLSAGTPIQRDLGTLRGTVRCPDDAPPA
jgi:hypothetical protein